jgi:hypothetical protein
LGCLLRRRYDGCCYPVSLSKNAFLKDALLLKLARMFGVPTVIYAHGTGFAAFRETLSPRLRRWFDAMIEKSAGAIVMAEALRSDFDGWLPAERVFVVRHGIEPAELPARECRRTLTILSLGLLRREKGIFDLLEAMPLVLAAAGRKTGGGRTMVATGPAGGGGNLRAGTKTSRRGGVHRAGRGRGEDALSWGGGHFRVFKSYEIGGVRHGVARSDAGRFAGGDDAGRGAGRNH